MDLRNIYNRQISLNLDIPKEATVVGCGGTGTWVAIGLAMSGVETLTLIDPDIVEISNLNRLPYTPSSVGMAKVDALSDWIHGLRGHVTIKRFETQINADNLDLLSGIVFCCTDNVASQQLIYRYCKAHRLQYHRVGYDGTVLNVSKAYPLVLEEQPQDGYTMTPSWVVPAAVAGMLGVASALYRPLTLNDDIKTLVCQGGGIISRHVIINKIERFLEEGDRELIRTLDYQGFRECDRCNRGDCDDCRRGDCSACSRGDCDNCDRRDCDTCSSYDDGYDAGYDKGYDDGHSTGTSEATLAIYRWLSNNHLLSSDITLKDLEEVVNAD